MKKSNRLNSKKFSTKNEGNIYIYIYVFLCWALITAFSTWFLVIYQWHNIFRTKTEIGAGVFLVLNGFVVNILYCSSIRDFVFLLIYWFKLRKKNDIVTIEYQKDSKKVILLYTTCDDFNEESIEKSIKQSYQNFKTFILDDSTKPEYKTRIDQFVLKHPNVSVVRRNNRKGFKAGNLNSFLKNYNDNYDFFVILDADEIVPANFIVSCIPYFEKDKKVGIVQANHKATRFSNLFDLTGGKGVISAWTTYISVKEKLGTVTLNGHGAMVSKQCYETAGGFPEIVAEDLGISLLALISGFKTRFAENVMCEETFPIDYVAFKKRNVKWTQGNFEFFKKLGGINLLTSNIPIIKKIDLLISTTQLWITVLGLFSTIVNLCILYPIGFRYQNFYVATILFVFLVINPLLNDFIYYFKKIHFLKLLWILLYSYLVYPSMLVSSLCALFFALIGRKAKFIVTPKNNYKYNFWEAVKFNWKELCTALFITLLVILCFAFSANFKMLVLGWYIFFTIPLVATVPLTLMSNIQIKSLNKLS